MGKRQDPVQTSSEIIFQCIIEVAGAIPKRSFPPEQRQIIQDCPTAPSTPSHLTFLSQRGERRPAARRASAGIATPLSSSRNNAAGRLSSCPKGALPKRTKAALQRLTRAWAIPCALCLALTRLGGLW